MQTLADRFRTARESAGLTKAQMARELGVSQSAVGQIEKGVTKTLKAKTLITLERVTGFSGAWIENGTGPQFSKLGKFPAEEAAQIQRIQEAILRLPPEHRAKIEGEIDFLASLNKDE